MNLSVALYPGTEFLRFDVQGQWHHHDALALACRVRVVAVRERSGRLLIDMRGVSPSPDVHGEFLLSDRLRRLLSSRFSVALLAPAGLINPQGCALGGIAEVQMFTSETAAMQWLRSAPCH